MPRVALNLSMMDGSGLTRDTPLAFTIELADGSTLATVGDVESYFHGLVDGQREANHWLVAVRMFAHAMREPSYLKAATLSLQTAFALDGLLLRMKT